MMLQWISFLLFLFPTCMSSQGYIAAVGKLTSALPLAGACPTYELLTECETSLLSHTHSLFAVTAIFFFFFLCVPSLFCIVCVTEYFCDPLQLSVVSRLLCSEPTGPTNPSYPSFLWGDEHNITLISDKVGVFSVYSFTSKVVQNWTKKRIKLI